MRTRPSTWLAVQVRMNRWVWTCCALVVLGSCASQGNEKGALQLKEKDSPRARLLFDFDWAFHRGDVDNAHLPEFDDTSWRTLDLPHDYGVEAPFGIRSLDFSVDKGFLLNGRPTLLKGGCVHHGNGPLGTAAYDRAEERRVELMKASGFNAIRCAHNPPSPAFLDAFDRLGMLVIDEAFDMWTYGKRDQDYHLYFDSWWQRDIDSMVLRDRNHPCVIMWSTGNEIPERGMPEGVVTSKKLAATIRNLDDTRPVTAAVNGLNPDKDPYFATLDISGYNYAVGGDHWQDSLYALDHKRVPERIMYCAYEKVELFLNDKSLGFKSTDRSSEWIAKWSVPYEPGRLKALAYDGNDEVASCILSTADQPTQIRLTPDRVKIQADGQDLSYVTVELLDAQGIRHPKADDLIEFTLEGPGTILAVGSSNPMGIESFQRPQRKAFQGRCLVVVKSETKKGTIRLAAQSNGIKKATVSIVSR
ncbi:MAG: glycoside hydrolase family 2 protein [Phycisphaeraceae bacterium]|nr:glycoside hydrolase family 2 protein [Phycisphaeraceae bacterium]